MRFEPHCGAGRLAGTGEIEPLPTIPAFDLNSILWRIGSLISLLALCVFCMMFSPFAAAQTSQTGGSSNSAANHANPSVKKHTEKHTLRHRTGRRHARSRSASSDSAVPPASTPAAPVPPAQQLAAPASIEFREGQLQIDAQNSSLVQILTKISGETGLVVEGLDHDERIYGQYGPGSVAGTLTALLDGAGYNYVIIGGGSQIPMKLLLTPRSAGSGGVASAPAAIGNTGAAPVSTAPATANPSEPPHPKTPQEIFNELRRMHPQ